MRREEKLRDLVRVAIPLDIHQWDLYRLRDGRLYDLVSDRTLTDEEEDVITEKAALQPGEYLTFHLLP